MSAIADRARTRTKLTSQQVVGFWASWAGWLLDGMDSVIYALVLAPALAELLPKSGMDASPAHVGFVGSLLFAVFLAGWGFSFLWGPVADRFGRTRALAATILMYALFTGAAAFSQNVWQLGVCRFLAGVGVGGEWSMAGTYVAEAWPEDRRAMGAGYLQTGSYFGFFVAAALNYTVGAHYGWRAMFLCGFVPVAISILTLRRVREPERWVAHSSEARRAHPLAEILGARYRTRTLVNAALLTVAIIGLWAGAVYEPAAITSLAKKAGIVGPAASKMVSIDTGVLSIGTILGCIALPPMAERWGRKLTLAIYFAGMLVTIPLAFGWAFYLENGLAPFITILFFMGFAGGNFAAFSLWLPEQYETRVRATAFAFTTSVGRFVGAGVNFLLAAAVLRVGTLGAPVAWTAVAFGIGILLIPLAIETTGQRLPE
ncbi:MAG TPA: MFS transporter [Gemmatimonadaceae bacterium]|nr:MFS transporter [Gemmatimonadaceae bacterium]